VWRCLWNLCEEFREVLRRIRDLTRASDIGKFGGRHGCCDSDRVADENLLRVCGDGSRRLNTHSVNVSAPPGRTSAGSELDPVVGYAEFTPSYEHKVQLIEKVWVLLIAIKYLFNQCLGN